MATAVATSSANVVAPPAPEPVVVERCETVPTGPLDDDAVAAAVEALPDETRQKEVAAALGVTASPLCFDIALVQAIAQFQRRYGRFEDEVTGQLTMRTNRYLQMVHESLRPADHRCANRPPDPPASRGLPSCLLYWSGSTPEQTAFMRQVYEVAQKRAAFTRPFVLAAEEVDVIEHGPCPGKPSTVEPDCRRSHWAEGDAARAGRELLTAARATFDGDRKLHGQRNLMVYTGYRSAPFQLEIWEYHFPGRYRETAKARARSPGGPHGAAAALLLAQYYGARTAPPGYSLHGRGIAIDFGCVTRAGDWIGSNGSFVKAWKKSYCFQWMNDNANKFGFRLNESIDEPWHWEFVGTASK